MRLRSSVFAAMLSGAMAHRAPVHAPPAVEQPLPAANVAVAVAVPAPSASQAPVAPTSVPPSRTAYGFLGKRGIVGTLGAAEGRWSGTFRFVDTEDKIHLKGTAWLDDEARPPDEPVLDGGKVHTYFDCEFTTGGALWGTVSEAPCLDEPGLLEIAGEWSAGKRVEPFYLCERAPGSADMR